MICMYIIYLYIIYVCKISWCIYLCVYAKKKKKQIKKQKVKNTETVYTIFRIHCIKHVTIRVFTDPYFRMFYAVIFS